jgi:hypothetical protein
MSEDTSRRARSATEGLNELPDQILHKLWLKGRERKKKNRNHPTQFLQPITHPTFCSTITNRPPTKPSRISFYPKLVSEMHTKKKRSAGQRNFRLEATKTPNKSRAWKTYSTVSPRASRFPSRKRSVRPGRGCRSPYRICF